MNKDIDYNEIERSLEDIINSPYDPENYLVKPEGTE